MTKTLVIINPHAGGGKGLAVWQEIEHELRIVLGDVHPVITQFPDDVPNCIKQATEQGVRRVISIGGDGTNNTIVNAILAHNTAHPDQELSFGCIPAGTGRDWARGAGTPLKPMDAVRWIANTRQRPIDVGLARYNGIEQHFLNISSAGISIDVVHRIENSPKGGALSYLKAIVSSLFGYKAKPVEIYLDGKLWYDGAITVAAIANGRYFGQGLFVAPHASVDDGLFDVIVAEGMSIPVTLGVLALLYRGKHLKHRCVRSARASDVLIKSKDGQPFGLDLDGEGRYASEIHYTLLKGVLNTHI